ncbi:MAG TPA: DUF4340 domain-containing protein [Methylomirabilota bacterium]|nr:DUF4340 domain-containing protein [Methylomirabilota bacterium]
MSFRTTIWLLFLALVLGGVIYVTETQPLRTTGPSIGAPLLPRLEPSAVTSIDVTISNQFLRVEKTNAAWALISPRYPAQQSVVQGFVEIAARIPQLGYITPKDVAAEQGGPASFGLEPPRATVLFTAGVEKIRLEVGNRAPIAKQVYVRKVGDAGVFLTDAALLEQLPFNLDEWRDPSLIHFGGLAFDRVQIRSGNRPLELQRTGGTWAIRRPIEARADANRVTALLAQMRDARVVSFVSDLPTADLEAYGLQNADVRAAFMLNSNVVAAVEFGRSPTNAPDLVYARRLSHTNIVLVSKEFVDALRLPYKSYHDPQLLSVPAEKISRIDVQAAQKFSLLRTNNTWQVLSTNIVAGDKELIETFMARVSGLEILDFGKEAPTEQDLAMLQLSPPVRRYSFFTQSTNAPATTNLLLAHLDFGSNTVDAVYVRRSDEIPVYLTQLGFASELSAAAWQFRDRTLWSLNPSTVTNLAVSIGAVQRSATKDPLTGWDKDDIVREILTEIVLRLCTAKAEAWTGFGDGVAQRFGITPQSQRITLSGVGADGQPVQRTIGFGHRGPGGNVYAAAVLPGDTQPTVFQLSGKLYMDLVSNLFAPLSQ